MQHQYRGRRERAAFVRPAFGSRAVVFTLTAVLDEPASVAACPALTQLTVEAFDPLRSDPAQRQVTERRADEPIDQPRVIVPGIRPQLRTWQPLVEQSTKAGPGSAGLPGVDLAEELRAELLRSLFGVAGAGQPQPFAGDWVSSDRDPDPPDVPPLDEAAPFTSLHHHQPCCW